LGGPGLVDLTQESKEGVTIFACTKTEEAWVKRWCWVWDCDWSVS
jgi:hypothetical protein